MHSYKNPISILAVGLAVFIGLGFSNAILRTSIVQFSMSIATSPEEPSPPVEPEKPVTEPSHSRHDGGSDSEPKNSDEIKQDPADVNTEPPTESESEAPSSEVLIDTPPEPSQSSETASSSSSNVSGGGYADSDSKANLSFVQKPTEEELTTEFEQEFHEGLKVEAIDESEKSLTAPLFEDQKEDTQASEVAIFPVTPIQFIKKILDSILKLAKKWWELVEALIVKHLF